MVRGSSIRLGVSITLQGSTHPARVVDGDVPRKFVSETTGDVTLVRFGRSGSNDSDS